MAKAFMVQLAAWMCFSIQEEYPKEGSVVDLADLFIVSQLHSSFFPPVPKPLPNPKPRTGTPKPDKIPKIQNHETRKMLTRERRTKNQFLSPRKAKQLIFKKMADTAQDESSSSANVAATSSGAGVRFEIKKWNAVTMWAWDICADTCAICRNSLNEPSIEYQVSCTVFYIYYFLLIL